MAEMKEITCKCGCGRKRFVYESDLRRGFGMFYNKSCATKFRMPMLVGSPKHIKESIADQSSIIFNTWLKSHVNCLTNRSIQNGE